MCMQIMILSAWLLFDQDNSRKEIIPSLSKCNGMVSSMKRQGSNKEDRDEKNINGTSYSKLAAYLLPDNSSRKIILKGGGTISRAVPRFHYPTIIPPLRA